MCVENKLSYEPNERAKDLSPPLDVSPGRSHLAKWPLSHLKISLVLSYYPSSSSCNPSPRSSRLASLLLPVPISNCINPRSSEEEEDRASKKLAAMALAPTSLTGRPLRTAPQLARSSRPASSRLSCRASNENEGTPPSWAGNLELKKLGKLAMVALAAGALVLTPVDDAMAGKSGGRVGGKAFRSAAPRSSGPRINNSRTNIYVNPAPPLVGGYGYGGYGGYGLSPFGGFYGGPSVALGVGGGFDTLVLFIVGGAVVGAVRRFLNRKDNDDYDD